MSSPSTVLTRGLGSWGNSSLLLTRGLGDFSATQQGPLVGIWQNVAYLDARQSSAELSARNKRFTLQSASDLLTLQGKDKNANH